MSHEVNKTTHISNDIEVYSGFAKDLGDNGKAADACITCMLAPEADGRGEWVYLTSNGDPSVVGYIDEAGDLEMSDEAKEWIDSDDMKWLRDILANL